MGIHPYEQKIELKPCPFCGTPMNTGNHFGLFGWHEPDCFFFYLDEHEVDMYEEDIFPRFISAWNKRYEQKRENVNADRQH